LVGLPSSCLALLFSRSLEKIRQRIVCVPELKALGLQGVALGWVLQYGDVKENIESAKKLKKSGISNYNIGLDVRRKSIIDFTKSS